MNFFHDTSDRVEVEMNKKETKKKKEKEKEKTEKNKKKIDGIDIKSIWACRREQRRRRQHRTVASLAGL